MADRAAREDLQRFRDAPLTYDEVGHSLGPLPAGYHHLRHRAVIGRGRDRFDAAVETLMTWQMHRPAGRCRPA